MKPAKEKKCISIEITRKAEFFDEEFGLSLRSRDLSDQFHTTIITGNQEWKKKIEKGNKLKAILIRE